MPIVSVFNRKRLPVNISGENSITGFAPGRAPQPDSGVLYWLAKSEGHLDHYEPNRTPPKPPSASGRFMNQVADPTVRTEIWKELVKLDRLISEL